MLECLNSKDFAIYTVIRNKFLDDFSQYRSKRFKSALQELNVNFISERTVLISFAADCYEWLIDYGLRMVSNAGIRGWTRNRILEYFPIKNASFAKVLNQYSERQGSEDIDWLDCLHDELLSDAENLEMFFVAIIADETNINIPPMDRKRAGTLLNNSQHIRNLKDCMDIVFKSIEQYPYNIDAWRQLIAISGTLVFENDAIINLCGVWLPDCRIHQNILIEIAESFAYIIDSMPEDTYGEIEEKIEYIYSVLRRLEEWSAEQKIARYFLEMYGQYFCDIADELKRAINK